MEMRILVVPVLVWFVHNHNLLGCIHIENRIRDTSRRAGAQAQTLISKSINRVQVGQEPQHTDAHDLLFLYLNTSTPLPLDNVVPKIVYI